MQNNDFMKKQSGILIFDNCFKWQYVGKCALYLLMISIVLALLFLVIIPLVVDTSFSILAQQEISTGSMLTHYEVWGLIITIAIVCLEYIIFSLPQMSIGTYRLDSEHLLVKEKTLGITVAEMYIPLSALTEVRFKKDYLRWLFFPYKTIELEASGTTYNLHCLAHQNELYEHLCKAVERNKSNN